MKNFTILLFSIIVLTSCRQQREEIVITDIPSASLSVAESEDFFNLNLKDSPLKNDFILSAIDSIEFLPLETTENSIIGKIGSVDFVDDYVIVSDAQAPGKVYAFKSDGSFSHPIGSIGEGAGEYSSANQVFSANNKIHIYDWKLSKLFIYNVDGTFISSIDFSKPTSPQNIYPIGSEYYIGTYAGYFKYNPFEIRIYNSSDSITATGLPFKYTRPTPSGNIIEDNSKRHLYYTQLSDTIYNVTDTTLCAVGALGLFTNGEVDEFMKKTSSLDKKDYIKALYTPSDNEMVNNVSFNIVGNKWIIEYQTPQFSYITITNTSDFNSVKYLRTDMKKRYCYFPFSIVATNDNAIYSYMDESLINTLDEKNIQDLKNAINQKSTQGFPSDIDFENSNPIIIKFTLK